MLWVSRLQSHETGVFYISQEHWEEQGTRCYYKKLYKLFEKHEKLYRLATKKLNDVELDHEELSTKFDEANQTIGALRFKNNFLAEKTK